MRWSIRRMLRIRIGSLLDERWTSNVSDWKKAPLSDFIQFKNGKKRPVNIGIYPVYGGNGILGYTDLANQENCVIIGRVGAYCGSVYYEPARHWVSDNAISATNKSNSDIIFDYYLLRFLNLNYRHIGTSQPLLTQEILNSIVFNWPPFSEQVLIGNILQVLDDKINNNNAINHHLEQVAQAVFKSWFVEFEPWGGVVPDGWRIEKLGNLCQSISKTHSFDKDNLIFLNTGDIDNGKYLHANFSSIGDMPGQAKKSISKDDILYSEIRPINRHFAYVNFDSIDYVVSTKLMVIRAKGIDSRRLYHYLTSKDVIDILQLEAESRSGTFPQIRFENIQNLDILLSTQSTEKEFSTFLHSIYAAVDANNIESARLAALRDTLLPRLMSGELRVSDISGGK